MLARFIFLSFNIFILQALNSCVTTQISHPNRSEMISSGMLDFSFKGKDLRPENLVSSPYSEGRFSDNFFVGELSPGVVGCYKISSKLTPLRLLWTFKAPEGGLSVSPLIKEGFVTLAFKTGEIVKLNLESGEKKWSTSLVSSYIDSPLSLHKEKLYVLTYNQILYRVDFSTGSTDWAYSLGQKNDIKIRSLTTPVFDSTNLYFSNSEGNILSINLKKGTLNWFFKTSFGSKGKFKTPVGKMLLHKKSLYVTRYDGHVFALNIVNGRRVSWDFKTNTSITASKHSIKDKALFIGTSDGKLYALDFKSGKNLWTKRPDLGKIAISSLLLKGKNLYVTGSKGTVFHINKENGEIKRSFNLRTQILSEPVQHKQHLLVSSNKKTLFYVFSLL